MSTNNESDDLAAFFAKKKAKDGKKKKVVNIDDVGAQLERKAKIQEQWDREEEERSKQELADEAFIKGQEAEDSEWIDATEVTQKIDVGLVKDMSLNENAEDEDEEEENLVVAEPAKTWNIASEKPPKEEPEQIKPPKAAAPAKYVPPSQKRAPQRAAQLDMTSEAAFPSLADAMKIEKEEKAQVDEKKKTQSAWGKPEEPSIRAPLPRSNDVRAEQQSAAITETPSAPAIDVWRRKEPAAAPAAEHTQQPASETEAPAEPGKPKYVPPHLRNRK